LIEIVTAWNGPKCQRADQRGLRAPDTGVSQAPEVSDFFSATLYHCLGITARVQWAYSGDPENPSRFSRTDLLPIDRRSSSIRIFFPRSRPPIELRARTASFEWQVSPLLLYSLPWHRVRTEPSRKVPCQSASCRATLFGGSREKCFAFRSRSVDGTEYVTSGESVPPPNTG